MITKELGWIGNGESRILSVCFTGANAQYSDVQPPQVQPREGVILCPPIGFEYGHTHRIMTYAAEQLALSGLVALKFDYSGSGDANLESVDEKCLELWEDNIRSAAKYLIEEKGVTSLSLLGFRAGALIAGALADNLCRDLPIKKILMWHPHQRGAAFFRDVEIISRGQAGWAATCEKGLFDCGGMVFTDAGKAIFSELTLTKVSIPPQVTLTILQPDNELPLKKIVDVFQQQGVTATLVNYADNAKMMQPALVSVVSPSAIAGVVEWAGGNQQVANSNTVQLQITDVDARAGAISSENNRSINSTAHFDEALVSPAHSECVAIVCRSKQPREVDKILVFINGGAAHRAGPARLYTRLCRQLAEQGINSLRVDFSALGDGARVTSDMSVPIHPYPKSLVAELQMLVTWLKNQGYNNIVLGGLCSAAHNAFHFALEDIRGDVKEVMFINPIDFYWQEGMSVIPHIAIDAKARFSKQRDQLIQLLKPITRGWTLPTKVIKKLFKWLESATDPNNAVLKKDLQRLVDRQVVLNFFLSESDPGLDTLKSAMGRRLGQWAREGKISLTILPPSDHAFVLNIQQDRLIAAVIKAYQ